jgi:NAD-dependent dihydropyrimidine dehydrogenase PreA subunit
MKPKSYYISPFCASMPIDQNFPKNHQAIGKHKHADRENFLLVWGPGRSDAESSTQEEVQAEYKDRGEEYVPLGVHGTMVAVDWDSCMVNGACLEACLEACIVQVYQWYRTEQDLPAIEMQNATSEGTGDNSLRDGRLDYADKSDSIREHDCIWCMAFLSVCPAQAIKVDQANLEFHEKAAGTFNDGLAKSGTSPPHAH